MDMAGVIERLSRTISLIVRGATPMARAHGVLGDPHGFEVLSQENLTRRDRFFHFRYPSIGAGSSHCFAAKGEPNLCIGLNSGNRIPRAKSLDHPGTAPSTFVYKPQQENPP